MKKHPLARAVRIDKLRFNALEASINAPEHVLQNALHLDLHTHLERTRAVAAAVGGDVIEHPGRVGGGGAPEYPLPGFAVALDESLAAALRAGTPRRCCHACTKASAWLMCAAFRRARMRR